LEVEVAGAAEVVGAADVVGAALVDVVGVLPPQVRVNPDFLVRSE